MNFEYSQLFLLIPLAFFAGLIDSAVGGGGLIQLPGIFSIIPNHDAPTLHGTNKLSSFCGTAVATRQYARRVTFRWHLLIGAIIMAFAGSYLGARIIPLLPVAYLRPIMLVLMVVMVVYTLRKKDLGHHHAPRLTQTQELSAGLLLGGAIGFYDGFFGPGTGSLLAFTFVKFFGFDFLVATAHSKIINLTTNLAALSFFIPHGYLLWGVGLTMGFSNILGALVGTRIVTQHGAPLIRKILIIILSITIAKFSYDTFQSFI